METRIGVIMPEVIGRWVPATLSIFNVEKMVSKFRLENGAWVFYLPKRWSTPFNFYFIVDYKLVEEWREKLHETRISGRCDDNERRGVHGIVAEREHGQIKRCDFVAYELPTSVFDDVFVVRVSVRGDQKAIEVLKPWRPSRPKYNVIVIARDYWSTERTYHRVIDATPKPVLTAVSASGSGSHSTTVFVFVVRNGESVVIREVRRTGRDNVYHYTVVATSDKMIVMKNPEYYEHHTAYGGTTVICEIAPGEACRTPY